jgi:hypothetical protein
MMPSDAAVSSGLRLIIPRPGLGGTASDELLPAPPPAAAAAGSRKTKAERSGGGGSSSGSGVSGGGGGSGSLERAGLTSLEPELYNQLRGLQKSARELRQVLCVYTL